MHNEALTVAAMCISNEDRSTFTIHSCDTAPTPTGIGRDVLGVKVGVVVKFPTKCDPRPGEGFDDLVEVFLLLHAGIEVLRENLKAWLTPYRKSEGFVCHLSNHSLRLNYLGEKSGLGWRQNALRHSYASYRLAEIQDAAKDALELGNSPEKLFEHYRELVTPDTAKEWFSIVPK